MHFRLHSLSQDDAVSSGGFSRFVSLWLMLLSNGEAFHSWGQQAGCRWLSSMMDFCQEMGTLNDEIVMKIHRQARAFQFEVRPSPLRPHLHPIEDHTTKIRNYLRCCSTHPAVSQHTPTASLPQYLAQNTPSLSSWVNRGDATRKTSTARAQMDSRSRDNGSAPATTLGTKLWWITAISGWKLFMRVKEHMTFD